LDGPPNIVKLSRFKQNQKRLRNSKVKQGKVILFQKMKTRKGFLILLKFDDACLADRKRKVGTILEPEAMLASVLAVSTGIRG
jgi:hypothetical protein